jgi:antirestriction protein ArdC
MVSVYEVVRDRIISSLEAGTVPWQQTWQSMCPMNLATGRPYRGINRVLLAGHTWWGTYNQIKHLGGYVRKGEKASGVVVFWSFDEVRRTVSENGDEVAVIMQRDRPLVRYYKVFNLSQCEGIAVEDVGDVQPIASCEDVIARNAPWVVPGEPAYSPGFDHITMPALDQFASAEAYYAAFFHELTHWTGHASRLNRPGITEPIRFGSERYSREELTAEMGAAFLCALTGTDVPVAENQAAYIAGWLRHIRDGSGADVIRAAADAQKAADFLTGGGGEASPFSGGVTGRASLLPVAAAEHRPDSSCPVPRTPALARRGLASCWLLGDRRSHHRLRRACS